MANYETTRDLIDTVLTQCGELTDGSSPYEDDVVKYLNEFNLQAHAGASMFDIDSSAAYSWAKATNDGVLILVPPYQSGFVNVTNGSNIATFTIPQGFDVSGWVFHAENDNETYRIISNGDPFSEFTLDSIYLGSTGQKAFKIYKLDYDLAPDGETKIMRLVDGFSCNSYNSYYNYADWNGKVTLVDQRTLQSRLPYNYPQIGWPLLAAEVRDRNGVKTIRFSAFVEKPLRLTYSYIPVPNDLTNDEDSNEIPNLPREFRDFLSNAATYKLMMDKDDSRANDYASMAKATLMSLVKADNIERQFTSKNRGEIRPRANQFPFPYGWR